MDPHGDPLARCSELLDGALLGEPHAEVRRDRIEPAGVDDPRSGRRSGVSVGIDHPAHPLGLPGEVAVVRPGGRDGRHQLGAIQRVGPDRRHHDPGRRRELVERNSVGRLGDDAFDISARPGGDDLELGGVTAGDRPTQRAVDAVARHEVPTEDLPDEAGRPVHDKIETAL